MQIVNIFFINYALLSNKYAETKMNTAPCATNNTRDSAYGTKELVIISTAKNGPNLCISPKGNRTTLVQLSTSALASAAITPHSRLIGILAKTVLAKALESIHTATKYPYPIIMISMAYAKDKSMLLQKLISSVACITELVTSIINPKPIKKDAISISTVGIRVPRSFFHAATGISSIR